MFASRLFAALVLSAALMSGSISPAHAQRCADYTRRFHWVSRTYLTGEPVHLAVREPYGYLADEEAGLQVLDLADPLHPRYVRTLDLPGQPWDVCVRGNYAYVSAFNQGLHVVDISDPVDPVLAGSVWMGSTINLKVFGSFAYVADFFSSKVYVVAVSDPANPEIVADVQTPNWPWDVAFAEDEKLMVVSATYSVLIVDIADPFSPVRVGAVPVPDAVYEVDVEGHYAFVAGVAGFYVIDFEDPAHPFMAAQSPIPSETLTASDGFVYLAARDTGMTVVDVRDPIHPMTVGHCFMDGWLFGFTAHDDLLYAVDYWRGINVMAIEDPTAVQPLGTMETPYPRLYVSIAEPYAYLADYVGGLLVADLSDPTAPRQLAQVEIERPTRGIAYDGGHVYMACDPPGLRIFDVGDPENPRLVGSADIGVFATRVVVRGGYSYVLGEPSGLRIVDVHDPANPHVVGSLGTAASDIELYGDLAYLASASGILVADIGDPTEPVIVSSLDVGFRPRCVVTDEGHLFVGGDGEPYTYTGQFAALSLTDPIHPSVLDRISTLRGVWDLERRGPYVWLVEDDMPVLMADVSRPDDLRIAGMIELAEDVGNITWDLALGTRLAVAANNGLQVLPCNLPITPYAADGGYKPPSGRAATLVRGAGAGVRLGFDASAGGAVAVQIVDVTGRLVRRLSFEGGAVGPLGVTWDTRTGTGQLAAPGVYFARMTGGGRQETRRLVVVR